MDFTLQDVQTELRRIAADAKAHASNWKPKAEEISARLLEVEQQLARNPGAEFGPVSNHGHAAVRAALEESAELKAVASGKARRVVIDLPDNYFGARAEILSTGITMADQQPGVVPLAPPRRMTVRSLLPTLQTSAGAIQYLEETAFTNAAAPVAEGGPKPESNMTFTLRPSSRWRIGFVCPPRGSRISAHYKRISTLGCVTA
jgi:hypothetical protein